MSQVLTLASDFIERMSNPGYGIQVNEDYSMRLGVLLSTDRLEGLLHREIKELVDPESLTPHGWFWLLRWTRARGVPIHEKLLLHLADSFSSTFMQVALIDVATLNVDWYPRDGVATIEEFDNRYLSELLRRCTHPAREDDGEHVHIDTKRSETVLVALMQIGRDITLDAANTLLNQQWIGQSL